MNQTKMTIRIEIENDRWIQGAKYTDLSCDATAKGAAVMSLMFPGTPEESAPIMQDLINGRGDAVLTQAVEALKKDVQDLVKALDRAEDARLAAIPVPVEAPVVVEVPAAAPIKA